MKKLLLGDEAIAQGAIDAGLSGVYAYPGTPSTEVTEFIQNSVIRNQCSDFSADGRRMRRQPWRLPWVCRTWANARSYV